MLDSHSVIAREDEFYAAQTASDTAKLDELMSEDLRFVHSTGLVETKEQYLEGVVTGRHAHGGIYRLSGETRVSQDGAVTIGVIDMVSMPPGGTPFTMRLHQTLAWDLRDGVWLLTARQATRQPL